MPGPAMRSAVWPSTALWLVGILVAGSSVAQSATRRATLDSETVVVLHPELGLLLEALPRPSEGLYAFVRRQCGGDESLAVDVRQVNGGVERLLRGVRYRVPSVCLDQERRRRAIAALFPGARWTERGWWHRVAPPDRFGQAETLWRVAEWYTGSGKNYRQVRELNQLADESIVVGQELLIPVDLLQPSLLLAAAAADGDPGSPTAGDTSEVPTSVAPGEVGGTTPTDLSYGRDEQGDYALYRLRSGEALYSAVVVRFTGRLFASDVNPLAQDIARRSGIADVTDIPVGYGVKIPFDLLAPEFLPPENPRRREYEEGLRASAQFRARTAADDLEGVVVILDAGHGGRDVGAATGGVWESLYVYDIMLRTKQLLETRTGAKVYSTTRDGSDEQITDRDVLPFSRGHQVLTTPPYRIETAQIGTNLRWYLANSLFDDEKKKGVDPRKVVYVSIHADSLHPSVRGSMVYVPGLLPIPNSYGKSGSVYSSRAEVRRRPRVSFSKQERVRSEGLSRDLANEIIDSFRRQGIAIHPNKPVRDRIVRRRGNPWVPAVLRYNSVPVKVLVEVCNLVNPNDLALIKTRRFRQQVAEGLVDGLLRYYGDSSGASAAAAAP